MKNNSVEPTNQAPGRQEGQVTALLADLRAGDPDALERLMEAVYTRIREIAAQVSADHGLPHTLTPTAVLHESFAKLARGDHFRKMLDRGHLFAVFTKATKDVLVDHARKKASLKRGGNQTQVELDLVLAGFEQQQGDLVELNDAIEQLANRDSRAAQVVEMRFFGGLTVAETARALGISESTVEADWRFARAFLYNELKAT